MFDTYLVDPLRDFMTSFGYAGEAASLAVGNALGGTFTLLRKPVSGLDLADRVATLLGEHAPRAEAGD